MELLIVVDMQNDFIDGSLGTKEAVAIVDSVAKKVNEFDGKIIYTRDTHFANYLDTQEGKNLPVVHCIKDTEGWQIHKNILIKEGSMIIDKLTFGSSELGQVLVDLNNQEPITKITLIGLCTDICVISNAMIAKAYLPEVLIEVDAACCAGVSVESHNIALEAMKMCQINIINA